MKFKKIDEWEDPGIEPGGDKIFLLEIVDDPTGSPRYMRMSCAELTDKEFDALAQGAVIETQQPNESP